MTDRTRTEVYMRTDKRLFCLLLGLLFLLSTAACGESKNSEATTETIVEHTQTAAPATEPPTQELVVANPETTYADPHTRAHPGADPRRRDQPFPQL